MSTVFVSREKAVQTPEQKKISSLAKRESSSARERAKSGPVTIVYKAPEKTKE